MSERRRGFAARVGVTLLNFFAPGLGLLRIGQVRPALTCYALIVALWLLLIGVFAGTENISFSAYAAVVGTALVVSLAVLVLSMWRTWKNSRFLSDERPIWSRWYSVLGALLIAFGLSLLLPQISRGLYHNFYLPSEAMEPTLDTNDRIVASMRRPKDLHRGDIVLVKTDSGLTYVKRIAALARDTIALKDGVVIINGTSVELTPEGTRRVSYPYIGTIQARLYRESFPGEIGSHQIQDLGPSAEDDFQQVKVPPGALFLLGDNRDDSADSRVAKEMGGLELVPLDRVVGRPLFFYWPSTKMGRSLTGSSH